MKVLIADDKIGKSIERIIRNAGYTGGIVHATSVNSAKEAYKRECPDIIFTDYAFETDGSGSRQLRSIRGEETGLDLAIWVRDEEGDRNTWMYLVSGAIPFFDAETRQSCLQYFRGLMPQPVRSVEYMNVLKQREGATA